MKKGETINIIGYSGSHMSLIFETLHKSGFQGFVRIIKHDSSNYFDAPFESGIDFEVVEQKNHDEVPEGSFFFCSNKPENKLFLYSFFKKKWRIEEKDFTNVIHPSSVIASSVNFGSGLYIEPLTVVSPYTKIGFGVSINRHCSIGHHNTLHDFCSIYPGSHLTGDVEIGRAATIGPGSIVFSGVRIGNNSAIGGGSVVTKDIPENVLAYGNPCRVIKEIYVDLNQTKII